MNDENKTKEDTVKGWKDCPFCNRKNLWMEYYDFGRGFTDTIDAETEAIEIRCECGCSLEVDVRNIPDVEDKKAYAIGKWNGRM